jgi:hypothetical protein
MLDLFAVAPKDLRRNKLVEYGHYLAERDGEVNLEERTLSKREASMKRFETPPAKLRTLDQAEFNRRYESFDRNTLPSQEMLLLLSLVKVNSAEAYGVELNFQGALKRALKNDDKTYLRIMVEETYHTRILLSSARHYGIEVRDAYQPPSGLRILMHGIARAPVPISRGLSLAGEIVATLMFVNLFEAAGRVLAHDPETRDAIEERLLEICVDERGHISYNRMCSGPAELAQARLTVAMVARLLAPVFPEIVALGAYPLNVFEQIPKLTDPKLMSEGFRRQSFIA